MHVSTNNTKERQKQGKLNYFEDLNEKEKLTKVHFPETWEFSQW
jgi:hypothetical protein